MKILEMITIALIFSYILSMKCLRKGMEISLETIGSYGVNKYNTLAS